METEYTAILMALLRSALWGEALTASHRAALTAQTLPKLTALAKKHDMDHLLPLALRQNDLLPEAMGQMEKSMFLAVFRCQRQQDALARLCEALEEGGIPFLPLKGAILRQFYPESWMRTSCDIDILVRPEDISRASRLLVDRCGCTRTGSTPHDVSFQTPNGTHLELHHSLLEARELPEMARVLETVWDRAVLCSGRRFHYAMPDELFYFYHLAHMAKHVMIGGCGIRPLLDLWILDSREDADHQSRDALLEQGGLLKFAQAARSLSRAWFGHGPMDPTSRQLEDFILRGGVYGNMENRVTVQRQKQGGWLRYLLSRAFLPMESLKYQFPVLQKHPWLMPFVQVYRWFKRIFSGSGRKAAWELTHSRRVSEEAENHTRAFLGNIGL